MGDSPFTGRSTACVQVTKCETLRSAEPFSSGTGASLPATFTGPVARRSTQVPVKPTRSKTWKRLTPSSSALARRGSPGVSFSSPLALI